MKSFLEGLDLSEVRTPAFVLELGKLESNLKLLSRVAEESGAKILLAQKAFSEYSAYPLVKKYLAGTASSGINEAKLAKEFFLEGEIHVFSPAYPESELFELAEFADSIVFNSEGQIDLYAEKVKKIAGGLGRSIEIGLRVNPEYSEVTTELYDPCSKNSRLGARASELSDKISEKIDLLHFHAMCEQNSDTLERILVRFEERFGGVISKVRKVNFGGGHHITRGDYDVPLLVSLVKNFYERYSNLETIYLEPGEAVALNAGVFLSRVLDVKSAADGKKILILDCSVPCHMPDVIEMPYTPEVVGAGKAGERNFDCILAGRSCLAGDSAGVYSFDKVPEVGEVLIFKDMAHYTTVKTNTFNGMNLPDLSVWDGEGYRVLKRFGYEDFKSRL